jgi:NAD(P)-dependent dehydrogenase (short-subunit alcohol dehydrogenase family)
MSKRFEHKIVVVTGAGGGLGRNLALGFAREGAHLILTDLPCPGLEETATILRGEGATCETHTADMASEPAIKALGKKLCAAHEKIDVLCNNAGLAYGEIAHGFDNLSQEKWLRFLAINTIAPLLVAQALRPALAAAIGAIVNQSSMASFMPATAYGVTKSALNAMTYGMATHFSADGIRVNAVAPGFMATPASTAGLPPGTAERIQGMQMLKLNGEPEDITALTLFLASSDARFITCEIVSCDAGNRMRGWRS